MVFAVEFGAALDGERQRAEGFVVLQEITALQGFARQSFASWASRKDLAVTTSTLPQ